MMTTKGSKEDKVKAAFEYADIFLRESEIRWNIDFDKENEDFIELQVAKQELKEKDTRGGLFGSFIRQSEK